MERSDPITGHHKSYLDSIVLKLVHETGSNLLLVSVQVKFGLTKPVGCKVFATISIAKCLELISYEV
jgi:hypothetical protein